jgi:hypothetical protein
MSNRTPHDEQIQRILNKLDLARRCDPDFKVFGSSSHKYRIGPPLDLAKISQFELKYGISLPSDYIEFLTKVGNGAPSSDAPAAGPFYGIAALGGDFVAIGGAASLSLEPVISPKLLDGEWQEMSRRLYMDDEELSEEEYDSEYERLYAGLLTIGHQGCQSNHALVVAGPNKGRVVNVDTDGNKPRFAFEDNFLGWYERWLDEIASGGLLQRHIGWFGYDMGGDDQHLLQVYDQAIDDNTKFEAINGLLKLVCIDLKTCDRLDQLCRDQDHKVRNAALRALTKFDLSLAQPHLQRLACSDDADRLAACQSVFWYAKQSCSIIGTHLLDNLSRINSEETFRFALYVLEESGADLAEVVVPFATNENESIRRTTFYHLGKIADRAQYIDVFLKGLHDEATSVVHATLQALVGATDERLLPAYANVAERYQTNEGYVRINLKHRLGEFGFGSVEAFERGERPDSVPKPFRTIRGFLARFRR